MRSFWSDPYLWVHLAGIAALPILLELCFLGLTVGDPVVPAILELALLVLVGIAPVLWMQWQRPFYIFSLLAVALHPDQLTVEQRKLLSQFKSPQNRIAAVVASLGMIWIVGKLYALAPLAATTLPTDNRGLGLGLAAAAFLGSHLFLQVPISVLFVLLTQEPTFAAIAPYPVEHIARDFTLFGWRVNRLLPPLVPDTTPERSPNRPSPIAPEVKTVAETCDTLAESTPPESQDDPWTESPGSVP